MNNPCFSTDLLFHRPMYFTMKHSSSGLRSSPMFKSLMTGREIMRYGNLKSWTAPVYEHDLSNSNEVKGVWYTLRVMHFEYVPFRICYLIISTFKARSSQVSNIAMLNDGALWPALWWIFFFCTVVQERLGAVACLQLAVNHFAAHDDVIVIGGYGILYLPYEFSESLI